MRGHFKGQQVGKITQVYRKRFCVYIERIQREKANGTTVPVAIHPSKVNITSLIYNTFFCHFSEYQNVRF